VDDQALLGARGVRISMSGKGNCHDTPMFESFFKTIKSELRWSIAPYIVAELLSRVRHVPDEHAAMVFLVVVPAKGDDLFLVHHPAVSLDQDLRAK